MKKVAVVILNWNGIKLLQQFLPSVVEHTLSEKMEIVVVDNCSTDQSVEFVNSHYPQVRCIALEQNFGYAEGYNQALKQIDAEYYVLLNSDVEVSTNWLKPIVDYMDANQDVAAAQPKILAQKSKSDFEYAGAAGGFVDKYAYPFCRGRIFGHLEKDMGQYDNTIDVFWATGACMIVRSHEFWDAEGFDSSFFAHMEEIDLCWRLNARGKRVVCIPASKVYHVGGATLNEESPRKTFLNFRNNLLMMYKNMPDDILQKTLRIRICLDYIAALKYALTGKMANAKEVHRAHKEFAQIKASYNEARKRNMNRAKTSTIATIYPRSVLMAYYVKGLKYYSQIAK